eukprot:6189262-Prorocentrum_lima.AAC.1
MTSSLVGSEMCIRDRKRTCTKGSKKTQECQRLRNCFECRVSFSAAASITVSYTHLTLPTICSV